MPVKTDRNDARGIAQVVRTGWFKPVHVKSIGSQRARTLAAARKHIKSACHRSRIDGSSITAHIALDFIPPGKTELQFSRTHSFDSGAAWANLANQAAATGWTAHGMSGFDVEKARTVLRVPEGFAVEIAIAVGRKGDGARLPPRLLQREQPSGRSPVGELVACGLFPERFSS